MKRLLALLTLLLATTAHGQIVLSSTSHTFEVQTSSTSQIDYRVVYYDETSAGANTTALNVGKITTATTTVLVAAPAASTSRIITQVVLTNTGAADNIVTPQTDVSTVNYQETSPLLLKSGESVAYKPDIGWARSQQSTTTTGLLKNFGKTGTASEGVSYWYGMWKDSGTLPAWAPGTPGVGGRTTTGTSSTDAGCINFPAAGAGKTRFLTSAFLTSTVVQAVSFWDVVWVNSGLVATTTTAQTVGSVAFPARDDNNSANGEGCRIGLYATAALGNAAIVSNSTISYTNSAGTGSRTASLAATAPNHIPATPVIGTVVWFELQAGDIGVQSIQSITLNTTLTSGSFSLFVARKLTEVPLSLVNAIFENRINAGLGIPIPNDACILPFYQSAATTATVINGSLVTSER